MSWTVAITGAAGGIGTTVRSGLDRSRFSLRLLDQVAPADPDPRDEVRVFDLRSLPATRRALRGVDAVLHLAAYADEKSFEEIHQSNVVTTYSVYEAARLEGVRRVVFASSVHVTGFYPWGRMTSPADRPRPDTFYALSKVYGENLGSMYADRYGISVVNLRIIGFAVEPDDPAFLWGWLSPGDTVRLATAALTAPDIRFVTLYGVSRNQRRFYTEDGWSEIGYAPLDDAEQFASRWPDATPHPLAGMGFTDPDYTG
ncbi:NAD-dependent epimerase/dehydratase family protein [Tenggerimyces flavus]|uniref:NAD-dependent epimerase/dehydratase family protein n=1 Tax=Tenggerimyces flavus TaxID=1708749 RepID=A0ABV7Y6G4_9ACTN|nr:NAD(P)-dependent oxidoreductase [Tenggerimyces flavus]MBM7785302.1 uronate dehydrogenase [Tenggerimyces flavus]